MQNIPLAERIRPKKLAEVIGQKHLIGENGSLKSAIDNKLIPSMIFWGPPGVGKTTLSNLIAQELDRPFYTLSAINSGVKDVREVIHKASSLGLFGKDIPILFIDEIHRFSKAQQDSLLGAVEKGVITLIGATTENPSFEVISALLSRSQVYVLESLSKEDLQALLERALREDEVLSKLNINLKETAALMQISGGDARKLLNILELVVSSINEDEISTNTVDGQEVPPRHFGIIMQMPDWENMVRHLEGKEIQFLIQPQIRFKGKNGEQSTFFILDPFGNALEFKAFNDDSQIFIRLGK